MRHQRFSIARMLVVAACCLLTPSICLADDKASNETPRKQLKGLAPDWKRTVEIPPVKAVSTNGFKGATFKLWVEQGWLLVRREMPTGEMEWRIVLARADDPQSPEIQVNTSDQAFEVSYGNYLVRENLGMLRVRRELKTSHSPPWPRLPLDPERAPRGWGGGNPIQVTAWMIGDWCWMESGLPNERRDAFVRGDVCVRLEPKDNDVGRVLRASSLGRLTYEEYGSGYFQDEGDLLIVRRALPHMVEYTRQLRKVRKEIGDKPAPALAVSEWLNTSCELPLDKLRRKVVLLDFWGTWCVPCVRKLPAVEALHQKCKDRGLVVVGVHSAIVENSASEAVGIVLKKHGVTFPIAIDKGETAERYAINVWPTYFLIDRTDKVVWGFSAEPPTETQIEELLR
jgi:thiol-disulfide isomerase/thioredoxin